MTTAERNEQIFELRQGGKAFDEIAQLFNLAVSTVKTIFYKVRKMLGLTTPTATKEKRNFTGCVTSEIVTPAKGVPTAYVVDFVDERGNVVFMKVGKTTRFDLRMKEHLTRYTNIAKIIVRKVYTFATNEECEIMESLMRKYYKAKNNKADFVRNDRFSEQRFCVEDEQIFNGYRDTVCAI